MLCELFICYWWCILLLCMCSGCKRFVEPRKQTVCFEPAECVFGIFTGGRNVDTSRQTDRQIDRQTDTHGAQKLIVALLKDWSCGICKGSQEEG